MCYKDVLNNYLTNIDIPRLKIFCPAMEPVACLNITIYLMCTIIRSLAVSLVQLKMLYRYSQYIIINIMFLAGLNMLLKSMT